MRFIFVLLSSLKSFRASTYSLLVKSNVTAEMKFTEEIT